LTCDSEGAALGGIPVAWCSEGDDGASRWQTRSSDEIREILERAYGPQRGGVVERFHRGLRRVATHLEAGDVALAAMEALMLRLPSIGPDGMAKLAALNDLTKGGDAWENEPRAPAGQPDGGQWTTGGASAGPATSASHSGGTGRGRGGTTASQSDQSRSAGAANGGSVDEVVVHSLVPQSRRQSANGFFVNSAGGGVFFIPTTAGGPQVRPTEVHAEDAYAFQVSWDENGVISLKDAKGTIVSVPATTPEEVRSFNDTTGRALGVSIYTFPGTPLASPDGPPTAEEQQRFDQEAAAQAAACKHLNNRCRDASRPERC
jgi:hypothetical protein